MVRVAVGELMPKDLGKKKYADQYSWWPPPLFVLCITLLELGFFVYHHVLAGDAMLIDSFLIYRRDRREQVWRFLFYMMLHAGWLHLVFNLLVQVAVGLPLEMVHGSVRVGAIYMAGVLAGSLGTSIFDDRVYLIGSSGGVYALLAAHLANVLLNYSCMEFGVLRLLGVFLVACVDVGIALYGRHSEEHVDVPVSYTAHLTGALAGVVTGLLVLKNFEKKKYERPLRWAALGVCAACVCAAVAYNVLAPSAAAVAGHVMVA